MLLDPNRNGFTFGQWIALAIKAAGHDEFSFADAYHDWKRGYEPRDYTKFRKGGK
jgi:hypothetical protein